VLPQFRQDRGQASPRAATCLWFSVHWPSGPVDGSGIENSQRVLADQLVATVDALAPSVEQVLTPRSMLDASSSTSIRPPSFRESWCRKQPGHSTGFRSFKACPLIHRTANSSRPTFPRRDRVSSARLSSASTPTRVVVGCRLGSRPLWSLAQHASIPGERAPPGGGSGSVVLGNPCYARNKTLCCRPRANLRMPDA
jgi:hypothetical protein